jgi:hypothetical protein
MAKKYARKAEDISEADRLLQFFDQVDEYEKAAVRQREEAIRAAQETRPGAEIRPPVASAQPPVNESGRPKLRRQPGVGDPSAQIPEEPAAVQPAFPEAAGRFKLFKCAAGGPRLHVRTPTGRLILAIDDPAKVAIRGKGTETIDLQCGPQRGAPPVKVSYDPSGARGGAAGLLRRLEFE